MSIAVHVVHVCLLISIYFNLFLLLSKNLEEPLILTMLNENYLFVSLTLNGWRLVAGVVLAVATEFGKSSGCHRGSKTSPA